MKSKDIFRQIIVFSFLCVNFSFADEVPLKHVESFDLKRLYDFPVSAFASETSPVVLLVESGVYWWFNAITGEHQLIAKSELLGGDGLSYGAYWGGDSIMMLYPPEDVDKKEHHQTKGAPEIVRYGIDGASLRIAKWVESQDLLISHIIPYVLEGRSFKPPRNFDYYHHTPRQSGLVVIDEKRYVTSGYEDQSLVVRSLPDGKILNRWVLGKWYSSRRINHIAVVHDRLLVASDGGRIEERSLETGEVLWSIRPCRGGGAFFRHSSQNLHMGRSESPPLESINIDGDVYYTCGPTFGRIGRVNNEWHHEVILTKKQLPGAVSTVETLPHTSLSVLVLHNGDVLVVDREKREIVQALPKTLEWHPNSATYIAATHQLLTVGEDGRIHLFDVPTHE